MNLPINDNTFLQLAMHHYDNPQCTTIEEFDSDIKRFMYIRKLMSRYRTNNDLRERLILNHIIILYNVFGIITTEFLFFKIDKELWNILATFLVYLNSMPEYIPEFDIRLSDLTLDENVIQALRNL